jgi:uncharacterized protein
VFRSSFASLQRLDSIELLVFSREEFERRSQVPGTVPYWAKKEGKLLYDAAA